MTTGIVPHLSYAQAQKLRRALIERGVDRYRVMGTPTNLLEQLERSTRLTLVKDVDTETPDEAFSTAFYRARMRGQTLDFPATFDGLGGDAS